MNEAKQTFPDIEKPRLSAAEVSRPLFKARGWMAVIGILSMIGGVVIIPFAIWRIVDGSWMNLSMILFGAVAIWQGRILFHAAKAIGVAHTENDDYALFAALAHLSTWFKIMGWMLIIKFILQNGFTLFSRYIL